jgi:hypothetical protein
MPRRSRAGTAAVLLLATAVPLYDAAARPFGDESASRRQGLPLLLDGEASESALAVDLKRGLQKQWLRGVDEHGESITIMAVGEAGVGKTTLFSNLFLRDLSSPAGPTQTILEQTVHFGARAARRAPDAREGIRCVQPTRLGHEHLCGCPAAP